MTAERQTASKWHADPQTIQKAAKRRTAPELTTCQKQAILKLQLDQKPQPRTPNEADLPLLRAGRADP